MDVTWWMKYECMWCSCCCLLFLATIAALYIKMSVVCCCLATLLNWSLDCVWYITCYKVLERNNLKHIYFLTIKQGPIFILLVHITSITQQFHSLVSYFVDHLSICNQLFICGICKHLFIKKSYHRSFVLIIIKYLLKMSPVSFSPFPSCQVKSL